MTKKQPPLIRATADAELVAELRSEPGYRTITFGGKRYHWLFCGLGIARAQAIGKNPLNELLTLQEKAYRAAVKSNGAKVDEQKVEAAVLDVLKDHTLDQWLLTYALILWTGIVPFYPDLSLDLIQARMTPSRMAEAQDVLAGELQSMVQEHLPTEDAKKKTTAKTAG